MKVLVADDSLLIHERMTKLLSRIDGIELIESAYNTNQALSLFDSMEPDVVILDISMPYTTGIDVLSRIKNESPETKVIILTSFPSDQFREICDSYGADHFLDKSEEFHEIATILKEYLKEPTHGSLQ